MEISESFARELIDYAFPRYRVLEELGAGSFGAVFKVESDYLPRAVKIIPLVASRTRTGGSVTSAADLLARDWRHLVERYERLRCPEVVAVHDFHLVESVMSENRAQAHGLALMDLYPGNLEEWVFDSDPDQNRRLEAICEIARILDVLERKRGFLFEDLKPENILVRDEPDSTIYVVVGDIGGLKSIGSVSRASTSVQMSLDYAAPEVVRGRRKVDTPAVIYGFGMLAFFVLEGGRLPHPDAGFDDRFDLLRDVGPDFQEAVAPHLAGIRNIISRCLTFTPEDRYPDFASVAAALLDGAEVAVTKTERPRLATKKIMSPMSSAAHVPQDGATIAMDDLGAAPENSFPSERHAEFSSIGIGAVEKTYKYSAPIVPTVSSPIILNGKPSSDDILGPEPMPDASTSPESEDMRRGLWVVLGLVLFLVVSGAGLFFGRSYFEGDHLGAGLKLINIRNEWVGSGGKKELVVSGVISNVSKAERAVPMIKIELRDAQDVIVQEHVQSPDKAKLPAGEQFDFKAQVGEVALTARRVHVLFSEDMP